MGLAIDHTRAGRCQRQLLSRASDADIAQATFLLQIRIIFRLNRHHAGEEPILHTA